MEGAEVGAAAAAAVPDTAAVPVMVEEVTVLLLALQGVVACHLLVDAAIAGHLTTTVHEKSLPTIMETAAAGASTATHILLSNKCSGTIVVLWQAMINNLPERSVVDCLTLVKVLITLSILLCLCLLYK